MSSKKLTGRTKEIEKLDHIYASDEAELIAIYGRWRVGKTFLIYHHFGQKRCPFFQLTGIHKALLSEQLAEFTKALNIPANAKATTWHHRSQKGSDIPGAQIDLLFDRPDGMVTLCEIKFSPSPITLDKAMADTLRQKIQTYQQVTKTHKPIIMSLISPYGLAPSTHAEGLIWSQAVLKDLFTK